MTKVTDEEIPLTTTTCQICACPIKSKAGLIAHHGYKRSNRGSGRQTKSCAGARQLPYEVSCDIIPPTIAGIKNYIAMKETQKAEFIVNPPEKLTFQLTSYSEPKESDRPEGFDVEKALRTEGCHAFFSYAGKFTHRIHEIEQDIKFAKIDLHFLEDRLAKWKPPVGVI
jgi:hypothetical protein